VLVLQRKFPEDDKCDEADLSSRSHLSKLILPIPSRALECYDNVHGVNRWNDGIAWLGRGQPDKRNYYHVTALRFLCSLRFAAFALLCTARTPFFFFVSV
jgi:hypothetical protein